MAEIKLSAEPRTEFGKGAARRIRRADKVPAVLYGHQAEPVHLTLPGHETLLALREANALLNIEVEGGGSHLALPKQVQRDPITGFVKHVDLILVRRGEKVLVEVPLRISGTPADDGMVNVERNSIEVRAEATNIPSEIDVSIDGLAIGTQILLGTIVLPEGVELHGDPEEVAIHIAVPEAIPEPEPAEEAEGEEAAEGEETAEGEDTEEA